MMKQIPFLLIALAMLLCSCSDEVVSDGVRNYSAGVPSVTFSFDSIESPNVWAQYQSLEEMFAACQIPEEKLKSMSTDELVEVCMSHPLYGIYSAYNNELEGAKVVIDHFNGFEELNKRSDAAEKLLAFYKDVNFNSSSHHRKDFSQTSYVGFIDLCMASKRISALYEGQYLGQLEAISNSVLESRAQQTPNDIFTIRRTLLIASQVKLTEGALRTEEAQILKSFVEAGANVNNPQVYSEVSAIISK